jgi:hypothetical protein
MILWIPIQYWWSVMISEHLSGYTSTSSGSLMRGKYDPCYRGFHNARTQMANISPWTNVNKQIKTIGWVTVGETTTHWWPWTVELEDWSEHLIHLRNCNHQDGHLSVRITWKLLENHLKISQKWTFKNLWSR